MKEYKPFKEGKVREVYDNDDSLIIVATDRISAFDVILKNKVTDKGAILTQMSKFWFDFTKDVVSNHMISVDVKDMPEFFQKDEFTGNSFRASDGSVIYFEEEGGFVWYQDDSDHSDNYYSGTYDVYFGEEAEDYIVNDLAEYGVTEEELEDYYESNITNDLLIRQHLCCIVLHTEELIIGGENQRDEPYDKNYMGFYQNGFFDGAYMEAAEYAYFTLIESRYCLIE